MKKVSFIQTTANLINAAEASFNGQRNILYRVFFAHDEQDKVTKANVIKAVGDEAPTLRKALAVVKASKKGDMTASVHDRLKAASYFRLNARKGENGFEISVTYTVDHVLAAAHAIQADADKPAEALRIDVLTDMLKSKKKTLTKANTALAEAKTKLKEIEDQEYKDFYQQKAVDPVSGRVERLQAEIAWLKAEKAELTK